MNVQPIVFDVNLKAFQNIIFSTKGFYNFGNSGLTTLCLLKLFFFKIQKFITRSSQTPIDRNGCYLVIYFVRNYQENGPIVLQFVYKVFIRKA